VVTRGRDLRTGRSVWQTRLAPPVPTTPLRRDAEADVLIIGAGITGAMIADALAASGMSIALVDKRGPAKGSTTASTALVQYEIDTPLRTLSQQIGARDAARAWRRSRLAVDALAARLGELDPHGMARRDTLYLAGDLLDADALQQEAKVRRSIGLACRFVDRRTLQRHFGIRAQAAITGYGDLMLDPRRTTRAVLRAALDRGISLHAPVEIVDLDAGKAQVTATADNGRRIRCRRLVFATGYELPKSVKVSGHRIVSTWAMATRPQPRRLWP
jgi:glycine/D-amino acid oxidase-like deaminating enzyme